MKKIIITLLFIFYAITAIASQEADDKLQKDKTNITFSPIAYSFFEGSLSDINDNYTYKEQISDIPARRISLEKLYKLYSWNGYSGHFVQLSHNRANTDINPYGDFNYQKKRTSITSISFGLTGMQGINFISNQLYFKLSLGFSYIQIWRKEINNDTTVLGKYIDVGLRYVFSSLTTQYNFNTGIDFSYLDSSLKSNVNCYRGIGISGIYPYIGIMW